MTISEVHEAEDVEDVVVEPEVCHNVHKDPRHLGFRYHDRQAIPETFTWEVAKYGDRQLHNAWVSSNIRIKALRLSPTLLLRPSASGPRRQDSIKLSFNSKHVTGPNNTFASYEPMRQTSVREAVEQGHTCLHTLPISHTILIHLFRIGVPSSPCVICSEIADEKLRCTQ